MTRPPRGLSPHEAEMWARLAATVTPLRPAKPAKPAPVKVAAKAPEKPAPVRPAAKAPQRAKPRAVVPAAKPQPQPPAKPPTKPPAKSPAGLDSHWERRLGRTSTDPEFTLDLHGHTLEQAYRRLDIGLAQAKAMGARLVLVITGKPRPVDAADRGERRGAIRAKVLDWLAAGQHAGDIAAIRNAQRRHGGEGAIYLVLKRRR